MEEAQKNKKKEETVVPPPPKRRRRRRHALSTCVDVQQSSQMREAPVPTTSGQLERWNHSTGGRRPIADAETSTRRAQSRPANYWPFLLAALGG